MDGLSLWHWIVVIIVVLLLFGRGKVSGLMTDLAQGIKAFRKHMSEDEKPADAHKKAAETVDRWTPPLALRRVGCATGTIWRSASSELVSSRCDFRQSSACLAIVLAIAAGFGVARIKVDDSLSQLFRSDTPEFKLYAAGNPPIPVKRIRRTRSSSMARHCWSAPRSQNFAIWSSICN